MDPETLWILDEAGSHIAMTPIHARAPRGERAPDVVPRNRGTVTTMLAALTLAGMEALMTVLGGTSGPVFIAYVEHILAPLLREGDTVILDNLAAHKVQEVRVLVEARGAKLKFLPPYSPDLSPIELAWSKVKQAMRAAKPRTHRDIDEAFLHASRSVTPSDACSYFKACGYQAQP